MGLQEPAAAQESCAGSCDLRLPAFTLCVGQLAPLCKHRFPTEKGTENPGDQPRHMRAFRRLFAQAHLLNPEGKGARHQVPWGGEREQDV